MCFETAYLGEILKNNQVKSSQMLKICPIWSPWQYLKDIYVQINNLDNEGWNKDRSRAKRDMQLILKHTNILAFLKNTKKCF